MLPVDTKTAARDGQRKKTADPQTDRGYGETIEASSPTVRSRVGQF
jgi:hypothetical protein